MKTFQDFSSYNALYC